MKKILFAFLLIAIVLTSIIAAVEANDSTVTLTVNPDQNNATTYPYDAYSQVTLNETLVYNDVQSINYPTDGLVGLQINDSTDHIMIIRTLSTGITIPYGIAATISQAYLSDASENQISSISIPSASNPVIPRLYFKVTNNLNTVQSVIVTLNVYDSNGVPIAETSQPMSGIPSLSSEVSLVDFSIPSWAHFGTAYAFVNVYSNWPSQGGVPLGEENAFQFTITGGTPFQGTPPLTNSLNGLPYKNFNTTFRLPLNSALGQYTAYSSTSYQNIPASQTTHFNVAQLADINSDGAVNFNDITYFVGLYIAYFTNGLFSPQIDFIHSGNTINFNDIIVFVGYYILAWSS
jgi:hypothetical protein